MMFRDDVQLFFCLGLIKLFESESVEKNIRLSGSFNLFNYPPPLTDAPRLQATPTSRRPLITATDAPGLLVAKQHGTVAAFSLHGGEMHKLQKNHMFTAL